MYETELYHHGVKGMKWGVRRYQNYDGSYTRAGVKRFDNALSEYEKKDKRYKDAKAAYKSAKKTGLGNGTEKTELVNSKLARKKAKRNLEKHYKHLKQDKLGDKGKALYANGKTITGYNASTSALATIGGASLMVLSYRLESTGMDNNVNKALAAIGGVSVGAAIAKSVADEHQAKKLRAYYSHTSNY